jgi:hypothetical protein
MARRPLPQVLPDLLKNRLIDRPPRGGYRWLHERALSGVVPAEQDAYTLRWSADEDDYPQIAAIIRAAQPASTPSASERVALPAAHPRPGEPAPRAIGRRRAPTLPSAA